MRPANLLYGLDDRPPLGVLLLTALQHAAVITAIGIIFPVLVLERAEASSETVIAVLGVSMVAMAVSTLLQCGRYGPIGSGYLAPAIFTAAYLPPSLAAAEEGGLPLVFGMTIFAGLCQVALAPAIRRLRPYLPAEIAGLAVTVVGIVLGMLGFRLVFGLSGGGAGVAGGQGYSIGLATLAITIGLSVWGTGPLRLFAALIGLVVGCLLALSTGLMDLAPLASEAGRRWLELPLPLGLWSLDFSPGLAIEFFVGALACSLRAMGDLTTCQKINDPKWVRPDFQTIRRGVLADGLGTICAGLLGTVGTNTFSGSVGLSVASGVTARRVAWGIAGIFLLLSMVPAFKALIAAIPREVTGGILIFSSSFIILNGVQVMTSRLLDNRKIILIGVALILGLSRDIFPDFYVGMPDYLTGVLGSQLVIAIGSAILLNLLFRIGISKKAQLAIRSGPEANEAIQRFMEEQGAAWGARRDVIRRVTTALIEFSEQASGLLTPGGDAQAEIAYDEFTIVVTLRYQGRPLGQAGPALAPEDLLERDLDEAIGQVELLLLRRLADRFQSQEEGGTQVVKLRFEH